MLQAVSGIEDNMANRNGFTVSNPILLLIIGVLTAGILSDGKLYNRQPPLQTIYPHDNAAEQPELIELYHDDQLHLSFIRSNSEWTQTTPIKAPAQQQRVQVLLDTNSYSRRQYPESSLSGTDVFNNSITLKIDGDEFHFGDIEPVSKLRYVRANNHIYLQPDYVIPLLGAANNAFVDLKISNDVQQLRVGESVLGNADRWSNLTALSLVENELADQYSTTPGVDIELLEKNRTIKLTAYHTNKGYVVSAENGFHYLLGSKTAESIGLADLLLTKQP